MSFMVYQIKSALQTAVHSASRVLTSDSSAAAHPSPNSSASSSLLLSVNRVQNLGIFAEKGIIINGNRGSGKTYILSELENDIRVQNTSSGTFAAAAAATAAASASADADSKVTSLRCVRLSVRELLRRVRSEIDTIHAQLSELSLLENDLDDTQTSILAALWSLLARCALHSRAESHDTVSQLPVESESEQNKQSVVLVLLLDDADELLTLSAMNQSVHMGPGNSAAAGGDADSAHEQKDTAMLRHIGTALCRLLRNGCELATHNLDWSIDISDAKQKWGLVCVAAVRESSRIVERFFEAGLRREPMYLRKPSTEQRITMLVKLLGWESYDSESEYHTLVRTVAAKTAGMMPGDLRKVVLLATLTFCAEFAHADSAEKKGPASPGVLQLEHFEQAIGQIRVQATAASSSGSSTVSSHAYSVSRAGTAAAHTWDRFGGYHDEVRRVQSLVKQWQGSSALRRLGVEPPRGILLHGPSGCGKTMLARIITSQSDLNCVFVRASDIFAKYLGESERTLRRVFADARALAPCVVVMDELDALAAKRSFSSGDGAADADGGNSVESRVLATLLNELDGVADAGEVYVVATTNRLSSVDEALIRPGRMDQLIELQPPATDTDRLCILTAHNKSLMLQLPNEKLSEIAASSSGWSGAELCQWCEQEVLYRVEQQQLVLSAHSATTT
jgi:ATP-dependent 26S proteasome regulatory subunit